MRSTKKISKLIASYSLQCVDDTEQMIQTMKFAMRCINVEKKLEDCKIIQLLVNALCGNKRQNGHRSHEFMFGTSHSQLLPFLHKFLLFNDSATEDDYQLNT